MPARTARWIASDSAMHALRRAVAHVDHGGARPARGVDLARGVRAEDRRRQRRRSARARRDRRRGCRRRWPRAAATAAVAVPWKSVSALAARGGDVARGELRMRGCRAGSPRARSAGSWAVTGGGASAGSTTRSRQGDGRRERVGRRRLRARRVAVGLGVAQQARTRGGRRRARGRPRASSARRRPRCGARRARGRSGRRPGRAGRRRSTRRVGVRRRRRLTSPGSVTRGARRRPRRPAEADGGRAQPRRRRPRPAMQGAGRHVITVDGRQPRPIPRDPIPPGPRARAPARAGSAPRGTPPTAPAACEHRARADQVAPRERAARVVEAQLHAPSRCPRRGRRPRRARSTPR